MTSQKFDLIPVDIGCNHDNGVFSGRAYFFHFMECILSTSIFDDDIGFVGTKIELGENQLGENRIVIYKNGFVGTKIELGENQIVIYKNLESKRNISVPVFKTYTCPATWTAETVLISRQSLADILNFLNRHSKEEWCMEEAWSEIFEKWENNKKFIASDFIEVKVPLAVNKKEDDYGKKKL